ncbi:MAG: PKD domain-containing protein, partial [Flavobacteriales bacterium]|nr:PKD domain-containing protein [Flavobacteriales bacterium]
MKKLVHLIIFLFFTQLFSISQNCPNADFSQGNFNNWQGFTGFYGNPFQTPGIVPGRHTIITTQGNDPNACGAVQMIPPGANFSCRLGNANTGAEAEAIRYTLTVDPSNALFVYQYAVVMEDPGHSPSEQPTFDLRVLNQSNQVIDPTCGQYSVYAGMPGSNFQNCGGVTYQNWRTVGLNLTPYMGQTITLEFFTRDCSLGGHYGYAYIAAFCRPLMLDVTYCPGDNSALIEAPLGFGHYSWSTGQSGPNVSSIVIPNPQMFQQVSVTMTSVISNQCQVTLNTNLTPTIPTAQFTFNPACPNQATPFTDQSFTNNNVPINQWQWNFGDGNTSNQQNPQHTYANTGNYTVELIVTTQNGCRDTVQLNVNTLPGPQANFDVTDVCFGVPADFTDQSTSGNANPIQSWQWDFGDGSPINNQQNPTHTYTTANTYNVTLSVTNSDGCTDSETAPVIIYDKPNANYTFTSQCEGTPITFTDQS